MEADRHEVPGVDIEELCMRSEVGMLSKNQVEEHRVLEQSLVVAASLR